MKRRMVWRYWCEFCRKGGCSGGAMAKHERSCTMNPGRVCRMCALVGNKPLPLAELVELAKRPAATDEEAKALVAEIDDAAGNCPMCSFAAIRQSDRCGPKYQENGVGADGYPDIECVDPGLTFDLKARLKDFWNDHNSERMEDHY